MAIGRFVRSVAGEEGFVRKQQRTWVSAPVKSEPPVGNPRKKTAMPS
jgi:hypothetical protein